MTLLNFDDDQMVPQASLQDFLGGNNNSNNCDLDTLNTPTLLKANPDFESLLTGLTADCPSWSDPDTSDFMYPMGDSTDGYRMLGDFERPVHDQDLTLYDDSPAGGLTIKTEKLSVEEQAMYPAAVCQPQTLPSEDTSRPTVTDEVQNDLDAVTREIDGVCALLDIPVAPHQWSVEQVSKWAMWTLEQYKLPTCYLYDLQIDGSTLCHLSEQDFTARWPQFGEYLYAQLEFWKGAYCSLIADPNSQEAYEDTPTYMDLTPISQACSQPHQHQQHHQHHQHHAQQQHQQQHQPQPAYVSLTAAMTSPTSSSSCQQSQALCHGDMMMSSIATAIPKPVLTPNLVCNNLSPASSLDSMDSFASSPSSETEYCERSFGGRLAHDTRPEVTPSKQNIHLWQFLRELLIQQHNYGSAIRWLDRSKGIFKIEDSARVARLWGQRKNRPAMNYDKLSRSIRQYYKKGIIKKTDNSKRLVYQFCPAYRV